MSDTAPETSEKVPLTAHLKELRQRLLYCLYALFVAFGVCFYFAKDIFQILLVPYRNALPVGAPSKIIFTGPAEYFFTQIEIALIAAIFICIPILLTQIYRFVAPGLYTHEKGAFLPYIIAAPIFFILGGAMVYFLAAPAALHFFASMQSSGAGDATAVELLPTTDRYLKFMLAFLLGFGLCFQLPVVLTLMARLGLVTSEFLQQKRRYAIVMVFVAAAIFTPPDILSQIILAVPTLLLYEISILAVKWIEKKRPARPQSEDI